MPRMPAINSISWKISSSAPPSQRKKESNQNLKPFIKWAGGKKQLLPILRSAYPKDIGTSITKYAEPFVGGGAVLFDLLSRYQFKEIYISDINSELIITYKTIQNNCENLIAYLQDIETKHLSLSEEDRRTYFKDKRERFNKLKLEKNNKRNIEIAALLIFLNKTCFNGLYRVNAKNQFNIPFGKQKNPNILNENNLRTVSLALKNINIVCGDFRKSQSFIDDKTFVYLDPPYRPLSLTASFTSYAENEFDNNAQIELANFVDEIDAKGAKILMSNSDPKNTDPDDNFFDDLYNGYSINRIPASRIINSNPEKRGKINELLISNYLPMNWNPLAP